MPKILSFEENKTFAKSDLLDLCAYLNALPNPAFLHYYFKIRVLLAEVLSNCGCLLYCRSMWQLVIGNVAWRVHRAIRSIQAFLNSAQGDGEIAQGCRQRWSVPPLALPRFSFLCPPGSHHTAGPIPREHNERSCGTKQSWAPIPHWRQRAPVGSTALGWLRGTVMLEMLMWKKRCVLGIDPRWAFNCWCSLSTNNLHIPLQEGADSGFLKSYQLPPHFPPSLPRFWVPNGASALPHSCISHMLGLL